MLTKPFMMPEGELHINVDAKNGMLEVAIHDEQGNLINVVKPVNQQRKVKM